MRINDRSKTEFDRAKIKLTGHFDRRPTRRYFEPCSISIMTHRDYRNLAMCNLKDNLVRMIRTMFGIGTIRKIMCGIGIGSGSQT